MEVSGMPHTKTRHIATPQGRHSRLGEPTWEAAEREFPWQGDWTEDEFLNIDNRGMEFVDGKLEFLPVPKETHQKVLSFLFLALTSFVTPHKLGMVLFSGIKVRTRPGKLREPDIVYVGKEHYRKRSEDAWNGADLAIEVVSPERSDHTRDYRKKREDYAEAGILEYWIVDPQRHKITILTLTREKSYAVHGEFKKGEQAHSKLLAGFAVDVDAAFAAGKA
jgi:Uma2 family endonuclease